MASNLRILIRKLDYLERKSQNIRIAAIIESFFTWCANSTICIPSAVATSIRLIECHNMAKIQFERSLWLAFGLDAHAR